jgi:hypothetical protein
MIRFKGVFPGSAVSISSQGVDENLNLIAFEPPRIYDCSMIIADRCSPGGESLPVTLLFRKGTHGT